MDVGSFSTLLDRAERPPREQDHHQLEAAVAKARQFQAEAFGGRIFAVSAAELIREAREGQST